MTQALTDLCYPIIEMRVAQWVADDLVDFLVQCVFVIAEARKLIAEQGLQEVFEMLLDEMAEWMEERVSSGTGSK